MIFVTLVDRYIDIEIEIISANGRFSLTFLKKRCIFGSIFEVSMSIDG